MPNTRTLPETPDRRAALRAILAAGAVTVPAVAFAAPPDADAELFALAAEIEAADQRETAAIEAAHLADVAYFDRLPEKPSAKASVLSAEEQELVEKLRQSFDEKDRRGPSPYEVAMHDWERERKRLEIECGRAAAEKRTDATQEAVDAIGRTVAAIRATTLAGLIFKAKYAVAHNESEPDPKVIESIIEDLLAMAEEAVG